MEYTQSIVDRELKGVTTKWLVGAGFMWTSIVGSVLGSYFSLKNEFATQDKANAIQDLRIEGLKRDIEIQNLQIRDLNERYNEHNSRIHDLEVNKL